MMKLQNRGSLSGWIASLYSSVRGITCEHCAETVQPEEWDWKHHGHLRVPVCPMCGVEGAHAFTPGETGVVS